MPTEYRITSEKQIENQILDFLAKIGIFAWKIQSVGIYDKEKGAYRRSNNINYVRGVSDILGVYRGKFFAIEVKSAKGVLSEHQKAFLSRVNKEYGIAMVARSIDDVIRGFHSRMPYDDRFKLIAKELKIDLTEVVK